ncbi:MAG: ABC transporter permease subunit [Desulfurococcales archaeon]|nr:ABC transporter permease subunit [Desulfurococcales archaeon]
MNASSVLRVAWYELLRESNKKSLWFVVALMILPFIAAAIVRGFSHNRVSDPYLWATIMGFRGSFNTTATVAMPLTVVAWGWLVAILFGGDLFASDLEDSGIAFILSRPISRAEYVAGKTIAALVMMIIVFYVGGLSVYGASWILAGRQAGFLEMSVESVLAGLGALPLLLATALLGIKFRKPVIGYVLGFVVYFGVSVAAGLLSAYYLVAARNIEAAVKASIIFKATIPFTSVSGAASILYGYLHPRNPVVLPVGPGETVEIDIGGYLALALVSLFAWIIVLSLLAYVVVKRMDF